jgi:kynurenine 3-monooxygenase
MIAKSTPLTIAGAGLAGALLALYLARRGHSVTVFERRSDPRRAGYLGGRSINLALAERGMHALRVAGLERDVLDQAVMMRGRMVHFAGTNETQLQRYGRDDSEVIWSINRGRLNMTVLDAAEAAGAQFHFDRRLAGIDFCSKKMTLVDDADADGSERTHAFTHLLGADGAGSAVRVAMGHAKDLGERFEPLGHGYKELEIPAAPGGGFLIERNALHIWPRGGYMCIALPNADGSFTVTLFLPNESGNPSEPSFSNVQTAAEAQALFARDFPDALALIPDLANDFVANPTGMLGTLRLDRWHLRDALLLGDAAHAIVPFHGQGMNCAFEDCVELDTLFGEADDFDALREEFQRRRKPNADAIAEMALENYIEMRDRVDDPDFLLQKQLERVLAERHPGRFVPRYAMVTFTRTPYAVAKARGEIQSGILREATRGKARVDEVDLAAADALVRDRLGFL